MTTANARVAAETAELLQQLLRRTHLSAPSDVAATVADQAAEHRRAATWRSTSSTTSRTGSSRSRERATRDPLSVAGTIAGRAFSSTTIIERPGREPGMRRLWLPLLDGTERLGVMAMSFAAERMSDALVAACERYAHLVALLLVTKGAYSDAFEAVRRSRPMTIAAELARALAPPMVFATDDLIVAGMLEPAYDNGGDALDYAINGRVLHVGVFDAMGHGLPAAGVAAFALVGLSAEPARGPGTARDPRGDGRRRGGAVPRQPLRHRRDRAARSRHRAADAG